MLFPSDPAVLFGTVSYLYSFERDDVVALTNGSPINIGTVTPGGVFGLNFGMGMALNEKSSFSIGYEHNIVEVTKVNGTVPPGSVRIQLATLLPAHSIPPERQAVAEPRRWGGADGRYAERDADVADSVHVLPAQMPHPGAGPSGKYWRL